MIKFGLTLFVLMALASGIPYMLLHKVGGAARTVVAYAMGSVATSATSAGIFLATHAILPATLFSADTIIGTGAFCAALGPAIGMMAGKRVRSRAQAVAAQAAAAGA